MPTTFAKRTSWLAIMLATTAMVGCGSSSSSSDNDDHDGDHDVDQSLTNLPGRLVITAADQPQALVYDLDSNSVMTTFTLDNAASAAYPSPQGRYALLPQRDQGKVQVIDGGLYIEDHGDHLHPYAKTPQLLSTVLEGSKPTHVNSHDGHTAVFFDGDEEASVNASVQLLADTSIASGQPLVLTLDNAMHGTAEPIDGHLLATWRAPEAATSLPQQVSLYHAHGDHFDFETRFDVQCPDLHGSLATEYGAVFGCSDGVLLVHKHDGEFEAHKIANPAAMGDNRIGSFYGDDDEEEVIGIAAGQPWLVNLEQRSIAPLNLTVDADTQFVKVHYTAEGDHVLALDSTGALHRFDVDANFAHHGSVSVLATVPEQSTNISITSSGKDDVAYVTDYAAKRVQVVDLDTMTVNAIELPFTPGKLAWLGFDDDHDHDDHDHDGDHDHDDDDHSDGEG
ncbi:hypothetical protein CHH28_01840 [Bacterioplanes sanyensis]|uniref:5-methyltetrahydrofolate--homocysteine methyltransferase n=1 Tax=Bacterioplanes sanyensis TaxID=1249553 RepID=A0A222FFF0_9GAMM|nr:hypothetical protein [Bacterioplanes sanyensis]ASP37490.1 hypothetical protein CHH28_01840 [Bacterioplanes sanyensis]